MSTYNGHKNWNYWNVSLWINNDEGLYNLARDFVRTCDNKRAAASAMLHYLHDENMYKTPDGARYSLSAVRAAMVGM